MGRLLIRARILPSDVQVKSRELADSLRSLLPQDVKILKMDEEPVAFGLVASIFDLVVEEEEGVMDEVEGSIRSSSLVSQVDIVGISRMSARVKWNGG